MKHVLCPHCECIVIILEENCGIFRHAMFKNGQEVPPHSSKEECDRWVDDGLIWGCGKPFQIIDGRVLVCEYI